MLISLEKMYFTFKVYYNVLGIYSYCLIGKKKKIKFTFNIEHKSLTFILSYIFNKILQQIDIFSKRSKIINKISILYSICITISLTYTLIKIFSIRSKKVATYIVSKLCKK